MFEPAVYMRRAMKLFEECRKQLGDEVELLHDVHERVHPDQAVQFAKDVEQFHLFFLEDVLSPEDIDYFRHDPPAMRHAARDGRAVQQPARVDAADLRTPDRFHPHSRLAGRRPDALPQSRRARRDLQRAHRLARPRRCLADRPLRNITLDLACHNFGIQEYSPFDDRTQEVFQGCPVMKNGYLYANDAPGWGIEIDRESRGQVSVRRRRGERGTNGGWGEVRSGTAIKQWPSRPRLPNASTERLGLARL